MDFILKEEVKKGWSGDKKYCATTPDGIKYLLRVSTSSKKDKLKNLYEVSKEIEKLNINFCNPVTYGTCEEGEYIVARWIDGKSAEEIIPFVSEDIQYQYGYVAGEILKKIHSMPLKEIQMNWYEFFNNKLDKRITTYNSCQVKLDGDIYFLDYIEKNRHLLKNRPITFQHGDYHIGNIMIENEKIVIIDFDRFDYGDPWEEFNRIVWCAQKAPLFANGMINGYFENKVPMEFWKLLALYISNGIISSIPWAIPFGNDEINVMQNQGREILEWYDNMKNIIPTWYKV